MEMDASVLTVLVIMAVALWNARATLKDLDSRQQIHKTIAGRDRADGRIGARRADRDGHDWSSEKDTGASREIAAHLDSIGLADPWFDRSQFISSACIVYETVVAAFARGDRELLQDLLSADVYETFLQSIDARDIKGERVELNFVRLKHAAIVEAHIFNGRMEITINIESELVTATRNPEGRVIAGDAARIITVSDNWSFAKELASRSPAWKLVATQPLLADTPPSEDADSSPQNPARRKQAARAKEAAAAQKGTELET